MRREVTSGNCPRRHKNWTTTDRLRVEQLIRAITKVREPNVMLNKAVTHGNNSVTLEGTIDHKMQMVE